MNQFIIREYDEFPGGRVLISLQRLIDRLSFIDAQFWSLREITFTCHPDFFGVAVVEIEKLSRRLSRGVVLADEDFRAFLRSDFQIVDGYIDCYAVDARTPTCRIECVDSAQWEISTDSDALASELDRRKFLRE